MKDRIIQLSLGSHGDVIGLGESGMTYAMCRITGCALEEGWEPIADSPEKREP